VELEEGVQFPPAALLILMRVLDVLTEIYYKMKEDQSKEWNPDKGFLAFSRSKLEDSLRADYGDIWMQGREAKERISAVVAEMEKGTLMGKSMYETYQSKYGAEYESSPTPAPSPSPLTPVSRDHHS
jgi:hypothetical protein